MSFFINATFQAGQRKPVTWRMFQFASVFNRDLDGWNVDAVTTLTKMFDDSAVAPTPDWYV